MSAVIAGAPFLAASALATTPASASTAPVDANSLAAKVDPAIVDINTTLSNGAAAGTGMILTSDGIVLTNNHVIDGATTINVQVDGTGPIYNAKVLGYDATDDVALIKMQNASGLPTVSIGDSSAVQVGDSVLGLGNALGKGGTPSTAPGTVTGLDKTITASDDGGGNPETLSGMIEINAPIQPGDSGGPLVNTSGQVIGMDSAGSSTGSNDAPATDAYAIPIDHAISIAQEIDNGQASTDVHIGDRAVLGVEVQDTTAQSAGPDTGSGGFGGGFGSGGFGSGGFGSGGFGGFGGSSGSNGSSGFGGFGGFGGSSGSGAASQSTAGVQIAGVASGSPAESAGLQAGDTITALNGQSVGSADDLSAAMSSLHPGDSVKVTWVDSSGQQHTATVTLEAGPPA
jgi:S1-C subfamily serine protease